MIVNSFRPDHRVTVRRWENDQLLPELDISGDVISVQTAKTYGTAAGGFVVTSTRGLSSRVTLKPHDMVRIDLDAGDGHGLVPVMVGLLTRSAEALDIDPTGQPRRVVRLTGMDLGKMLHVHNVGGDLALLDKHFGDEQTERLHAGLVFGGTPAQMVTSILETFFFREVPWTSDWILADRLTTDDPWQTIDFSRLTADSGALWNVLKDVADEPWNCLHTETGEDGKFHVVLERRPFDPLTGRLTRETFHEILAEDVKAFDLGEDDSERTNWHFLKASMTIFSEQDNLALLMAKQGLLQYDEASIRVHGFRPTEHQTSFVPWGTKRPLENSEPYLLPELAVQASGPPAPNFFPSASSQTTDIDLVRGRGAAMYEWFRRNHEYLNGQMTVKGSPRYRAGDGVLFDGNEFLVERVSQNYTWGRMYSTNLDLTRGQSHAA